MDQVLSRSLRNNSSSQFKLVLMSQDIQVTSHSNAAVTCCGDKKMLSVLLFVRIPNVILAQKSMIREGC